MLVLMYYRIVKYLFTISLFCFCLLYVKDRPEGNAVIGKSVRTVETTIAGFFSKLGAL